MSLQPTPCPKCNGEMDQGFTFEIDGPRRGEHLGRGRTRELLLAGRESSGGEVCPGGHVPVFCVQLLGSLRAAGVCRKITPSSAELFGQLEHFGVRAVT